MRLIGTGPTSQRFSHHFSFDDMVLPPGFESQLVVLGGRAVVHWQVLNTSIRTFGSLGVSVSRHYRYELWMVVMHAYGWI